MNSRRQPPPPGQSTRRDFIKLTGAAGLALAATNPALGSDPSTGPSKRTHRQRFNMSGYAAPKLETVRIGFIGIGGRGLGSLTKLVRIEGVEITALSDLDPERISLALEALPIGARRPATYSSGREDEWKAVCERDDVDLVFTCTPWDLHAPICVYAMENGKHAATEVPAAKTIDECWQLVETSERTRRHCMMLENVCYSFFELMTLKMAREGFFGDIIHGEGAYIHQLIRQNFSKTQYSNMWRLKENATRNGNLYPMHGLGPISQAMNINYGDKMDFLVSVSSNDYMMGAMARELAAKDEFYQPFVGRTYRGNMNTSVIRTARGRTIMLQHDVTSPRPYSRIHLLSGTKAIARKYPLPAKIALGHGKWLSDDALKGLEEKYTPEITKRMGETAMGIGGHGGMDLLIKWRLIDCLRNGLPLDMDVYDAALWSAIAPLTEWSVANRSASVDVPDFTSGSWQSNTPLMDIDLKRGGNTRVA